MPPAAEDLAWYIDCLDPVGGLCFAARRPADLMNGRDTDLSLPAVHIGPPAFEPEMVSSRAIAMAAAAGPFQHGLLLDGQEVAFHSLDALVEFVRRSYLSGGRGDSAAGRTGGPPPPEGGPDFEPPSGGRVAADSKGGLASLVDFGAGLKRAMGRLGETYEEAGALSFTTVDAGDHAGLADAAEVLFAELLARLPAARSSGWRAGWLAAYTSLASAIVHLGLWEEVATSPHLLAIRRRVGTIGVADPWVDRLAIEEDGRLVLRWSAFHVRSPDPFDDLASWPMPSRNAAAGVRTVADHLSSVIGYPAELGQDNWRSAAIALFAACHLVRPPAPAGAWILDAEAASALRAERIAAAMAWLRRQLPTFVFRSELEAAIRNVGLPASPAAVAY